MTPDHVFQSSPFAREWYAAREEGERLRAAALHQLYTRRAHPGGPYPDPRQPAAFSMRAIIAQAARHLGVTIWTTPTAAQLAPSASDIWLLTFPRTVETAAPVPPTIAVSAQGDETSMLWRIALMLGLIIREPYAALDQNAPETVTTLPTDAVTIALLHRFARALLYWQDPCPEAKCSCVSVEQRLNATPPDHEQPTEPLPAIQLIHTKPTPAPSQPQQLDGQDTIGGRRRR